MSIIGDIISVTKDVESRAKERRDIDELRQIQSLTLTLQSQNTEVIERDIRVMQENAKLLAENTELKRQLAESQAEDIRIHRTIEFRRGKRTGDKWLAFCPQCHLPIREGNDNGEWQLYC